MDRPIPTADLVAHYKNLLKAAIDRRPSGTRQRLALALGTNKSFISQITNPNYRAPLPAQHIPTLFKVCHFSEGEQRAFLKAYALAHPSQAGVLEELGAGESHVLTVALPEFTDPTTRQKVEELIREFADRVIALAKACETSCAAATSTKKHADGREETVASGRNEP